MLKSLLWIISFAALLLHTAAAQELRVLSADARGMTVEYRPVVSRVEVPGEGLRYAFDRAVSRDISQAGAPDLRFRRELVALPAAAGTRIEITQVDYRDEAGVTLLPVPDIRRGDGGETHMYRPGAAYSIDAFLPADVVRLENIGRSRRHVLGDLVLTPVQWNPATRRARVYTRILFRVEYGMPREDLISGSAPVMHVLNPAMARAWNIAPAASLARGTVRMNMADGNWYRFDVAQTGMYRLSRAWFTEAGLDPSSIDPRTIRLFSSGGRERPASLAASRPDPLQEIPIEVVGGEDGSFDAQDYVQFYGKGLSGFHWNPSRGGYEHHIHRFDEVNRYLLTFGGTEGRRMDLEQSLTPQGEFFTPAWFPGHEFEEEESINLMNSGLLWVGKRLVPSAGSASSLVLTRKLHGIVQDQPVTYRMQVASSAEIQNSFEVRADNVTLGSIPMGTVDFGADTGDMAKLSGTREFSGTSSLLDDRSTLSITFTAANAERARGGYVDWVEWHYARRFEPLNDELLFSAPDTTARIEFVLNGFTMSDVMVYDVTDYRDVRRMTGVDVSGGTVRFRIENTAGAPRRFLAVAAPALKTPGAPAGIPNSSLQASSGAEHLIITSRALESAARRLEAHRERATDPLSSMVVTVEDIYNEFNAGVVDPTAIRDFLAWAMENWSTPPAYVLFFGDGHYDYRNYTTPEPIIVPVWETENSINRIGSYASDDYYAQVVGNDARVDLATGRIPVQTLEEADIVVDKIIGYESSPDFAPWKNRVTFVADDGWTSFSDTDRDQHTRQSERLADMIPADVEQDKIYLVSYRTENTAQGRRKPDVNEAIIDRINDGTIVMNYTGHGAHDIWAHERVFVSDVTVPQLNNADRLTFVCAATCTFGLYDAPGVRSGTELLLLRQHGGSIGGLSAPRVVFSTENSAFNTEFFQYLLNEGREADGRPRRLGDAIYSSKQRYNSIPGYEKFHLFADPGLRLALPRYSARVDRILVNGSPVTADTVQLRALSRVTLEGSVLRADGTAWDDFTGTVEVSLFDAERSVVVQEPLWNNYTYSMPGGLLYRGQASVDNGRYAVDFIVPKDISYENSNGRIAMYFHNDAVDGAGYSLDLRIGGSDSTATPDDEGPVVQLYLDSRSFLAGDETGTDPLLIADLFDESGINTTGLGIGHDIEVWLDGADRGTVLNSYYRGDIDSYQRGTVEYRLRNLAPGPHTLRLRAWDIFNNSTTVETQFVVSGGLSLQDVANYPNPASGSTTFTFRHNVLDPVVVDVLIYASSGQLAGHLRSGEITSRVVELPWDGRSAAGAPLSSGIYIYRIVCRTADGVMGSEASGKLMLVR
jgi:hypothetical protein